MTVQSKSKRAWFWGAIFLAGIFLLSTNCMLGELFMMQYNQDRTATSFAVDTVWAMTYTEEARLYNDKTATAEQATYDAQRAIQQIEWLTFDAKIRGLTETALAPKPPIITGISFPGNIPGNKSTMIGLLYFTDADGDIKYLTYDVIHATNFSGGVDNEPRLDSGDWTSGAIKIYIWCDGEQDVTLRATIYDWAGNRSNSMDFSFRCE